MIITIYYWWDLKGVTAQFDTKWVGWPGVDVYDEAGKNALSKSLAKVVRNLSKQCPCVY